MNWTNSRLGWHFEPHRYWPFVPMHNDLLHQVVVAKYYLVATTTKKRWDKDVDFTQVEC